MEDMRRDFERAKEPPPPVEVRYFYSSTLELDDPLAPISQHAGTSTTVIPKPLSKFDSTRLDKAWVALQIKLARVQKERDIASQKISASVPRKAAVSLNANRSRHDVQSSGQETSKSGSFKSHHFPRLDGQRSRRVSGSSQYSTASHTKDGNVMNTDGETSITEGTTGTPFIRAPLRSTLPRQWTHVALDPETESIVTQTDESDDERSSVREQPIEPTERIPVGVSRLHQIALPQLKLEPIYWSPVNDVADAIRATWFYRDTMLPVETGVANLLEEGYIKLRPWTQTWRDELRSAVDVGALGEEKIAHSLWPDLETFKPDSRPGSSVSARKNLTEDTPENRRAAAIAEAERHISESSKVFESDSKASGNNAYGHDGQVRMYRTSQILYANQKEAYILRPKLQPSAYYGRRPLANYILKGHSIGICVVRGFDEAHWETIHGKHRGIPVYDKPRMTVDPKTGLDVPLYKSPSVDGMTEVTDLVLVIHGIGQKLSERMESFHFTHAMNNFRREVHVELESNAARPHLRQGMGNIMVLPINWRSTLSFEEGGYRDGPEDPNLNQFSLKDITPESLPSVRNIVSDVMLDIPYYLSHHQPKMISAVIREANRIFNLFCLHNPAFRKQGRVHLLAHSLGSVMAIDILSRQPTVTDPLQPIAATVKDKGKEVEHFDFQTTNLYLCGSPAGFFLLLKRASLLPRRERNKVGSDGEDSMPGVAGEQGDYGCLAVDNVYNIINPYDPVAYKLNAAVDANYARSIKPASIPSATKAWFSFARVSKGYGVPATTAARKSGNHARPLVSHLPSQVELETHNFTREEVAERRAYLLNDNGQIDYLMKYGGGPLEIQYLTMLGAHSSYWVNKDFVRFVVIETSREPGREGSLDTLKAIKKKGGFA